MDLTRARLPYTGWLHDSSTMRGFNELFRGLPFELQIQLNQDVLSDVVGGVVNTPDLHFLGVFYV